MSISNALPPQQLAPKARQALRLVSPSRRDHDGQLTVSAPADPERDATSNNPEPRRSSAARALRAIGRSSQALRNAEQELLCASQAARRDLAAMEDYERRHRGTTLA